MDVISWVSADLGLVVLTLLVAGLTAFLVWAMVHPERV